MSHIPTAPIFPTFIPQGEAIREGSRYYHHSHVYACVFYKHAYYISDGSHGEIYQHLGNKFGVDISNTEPGYYHSTRSTEYDKFEKSFGWEGYD